MFQRTLDEALTVTPVAAGGVRNASLQSRNVHFVVWSVEKSILFSIGAKHLKSLVI